MASWTADTESTSTHFTDPYPDASGKIKDPYVDVMKDKMIISLPSQKTDANGNIIGKDIEVKPVVAGGLLRNDANWEATNAAFMDINEMKALEQKFNKQNGIKKSSNKVLLVVLLQVLALFQLVPQLLQGLRVDTVELGKAAVP